MVPKRRVTLDSVEFKLLMMRPWADAIAARCCPTAAALGSLPSGTKSVFRVRTTRTAPW